MPISWTLILYIYAGAMSRGDSVTMTHVDNFSSRAVCEAAGNAARPLVKDTYKEFRFVCLEKK
jgi:hypothetical protein